MFLPWMTFGIFYVIFIIMSIMVDRFLKKYGISQFPLGTEVLTGAIIGGSSLLSGILGSSSAESARDDNIAENEKNRKFNAEQAALQRQWATDEWQRQFNQQTEQWYKQADYSQEQAYNYWLQQQEYNSPANQVSRLMKAGLNPAHVVGDSTFGSTGLSPASTSVPSPSVPSGSSASVSTSNPVNATSGADAFSRIASGASDIVRAITSGDKDSATAQRTKQLMGVELELLLTDRTNKELMNDYQSVYNSFFKQKMPTELKKLSGEMELTYLKAACARSEDDLIQLKSVTEQMQQSILDLTGKVKNEELTQAIFVSNNLQKNLDAKLALMRSQQSNNYASASAQRALAALNNANAESVSFWNGLNQENRDELGKQIVLQTEQMSESVGLTSSQSEVARQMAVNVGKQNDYYAARFWNEMINMYVNTGVDVFSEFTKFKSFKRLGDLQQSRIKNDMRKLELEEQRLNKKPHSKRHERYNANGDLIGFDFTDYGD